MSAQQQPGGSALTRETILRALGLLSEELGKQGVIGEVCLFGGTVMVLAFTARLATKDVDALFQPAQTIREIAHRIGEEQHLPANWLNDGVKGYVSARHETMAGNLPQFAHLRLTMPVPEYLLAMKCLALRIGAESHDEDDVRYLLRHLDIGTYEQAVAVITRFYPLERFPQKTLYALGELLPRQG